MIQCLICKHDASTLDKDVSHICHAFYFDEAAHTILYPQDPANVPAPLFYVCVLCADGLRKHLAPTWKMPDLPGFEGELP